MKALVKEAAGPGISYIDVPEPQIENPDDVHLQVAYCGVDLDDVKVYLWNDQAAKDELLHLPAILGHNAAGVVTAVGSAVTGLKPGDRVAIEPIINCQHCDQCQSGRPNLCIHKEIFGKRRGGFAEYAVVPQRCLHLLPNKLSLQEGALLSSFGTAVHAVEVAGPAPGDWAVVIGATPVGMMSALTLKACGANVIISDVVDGRLEIARQLDGVMVINARKDEPRRFLADLTQGRRADVVVQTMATQVAFEEALGVVCDGGSIVSIAPHSRPVELDIYPQLSQREIRLLGASGRTADTWHRMFDLIESGRVDLGPFVTGIFPMEQYDTAFELMRTGAALNVLVRPGDIATQTNKA